jgi:hypothetical protein
MTPERQSRIAFIGAGLAFVVHLLANPHYGFFRDELYFIVCGQHPSWGYVDQPPLAPLLGAASQAFGPSLLLLRAIPAAFAAGAVLVTVQIAAELGGGAFAQILAALGCALCPVLTSFGMKLSPDTIGLWLWPLAVLYLLRLSRGADPRLWLLVGAAIGVSAQAKYTVVYFAAALLVAILCTPERRMLRSRWALAGAAIAAAVALPNFLWQAVHGFPMLELLRNGQHGKNVILSPGGYLVAELLITNPILALLWIAGLVWLWRTPATRFLALTFVILIVAMIASHAKHYYPGDVYPYLFAAGGVAVESWTQRRLWLRPVLASVAVAASFVLLPYVLPVLPVPTFLAFHRAMAPLLHLEVTKTEHRPESDLPPDWADMHGWPELAETVAHVVESLPPADRARAVIVAGNYGEAAAIEFFGAKLHLPPVVSGHNHYFLWGTHGASGDVLIDVGGDCGARQHLFRDTERAAVFSSPYAMPYETNLPILICRGITRPFGDLWPGLKHYI